MSSVVAVVVAALGGSALTGVASLAVVWLRERMQRKTAERDKLVNAVNEMLYRSMALMLRAQTLELWKRQMSGLLTGVDIVLLRIRPPADARDIYDWMRVDLDPLHQAWSVIWALGSQQTVSLANTLLSACGDLLGSATDTPGATTRAGKLWRRVAGEKIEAPSSSELKADIKAIAHAREALAQHARAILGLRAAQLFSPDSTEALAIVGSPPEGKGERSYSATGPGGGPRSATPPGCPIRHSSTRSQSHGAHSSWQASSPAA